MMSSAWPCSVARARASCGFWCASFEQILHDGPAFRAVVAQRAPRRRADAVFRSSQAAPARTLRARPRPTSASAAAKAKASPRKPRPSLRANRSSIRLGNAKPETEQDQPADRGPEHRAPAKAASHGHDRRLDRDRQQRRIGFRRDVDRAAGRAARIVRVHHDHAGIVELEGRRPAMMRSLAHCSLSPIRNWRARSRRM